MDKNIIATELIAVAEELAAADRIAMPSGEENQVRVLLEAAKKSVGIIDKLAKSFEPMGRALRNSDVDQPTIEAIHAMFNARAALGKLVGICSSALIEHETAFLSSEKE